MKPEITRRFTDPKMIGVEQHVRIRRDRDDTYSVSIGGTSTGNTPGSWGGISGLTYEMINDLPAMLDDLLAEHARVEAETGIPYSRR